MKSAGLTRELVALRVAKELRDGMVVNLGIGVPTLVSNFIPEGMTIFFQAENGLLGYDRIAEGEEIDPDLINAGGQPVTLRSGACFFHSADSFAMIRGGHVDMTVLGGLQVSEKGDLANWMVPEKGVGSIGGAMDLAAGARRVIVAMEHTTKEGAPRLVPECTYPLTAVRAVSLVVTNLAAIEVTPEGFLVREVAPGVAFEEVQAATAATVHRAPDMREMEL